MGFGHGVYKVQIRSPVVKNWVEKLLTTIFLKIGLKLQKN